MAPSPDRAAPASGADDLTLHLEPLEAFVTLRALLNSAHYDEATVVQRSGVAPTSAEPRLWKGGKDAAATVADALSALIILFLDNRPLPAALLQTLWGGEALTACEVLGLLVRAPDDAETMVPAVALAPVEGLWLASDRLPLGREVSRTRVDFVYSAGNELTRHFLSVIPAAPGARVAELCAGTGIAALRALRGGAASAVAVDLVPRSVHFARFNARLNGLDERLTVVQSDVWSALDGESFDLVVAHPPYVPSMEHRFDFRDAGGDGEEVTRRLFEGVAAHLRVGGRMIVRAAMSDRRGATIAQRIRGWLGPASNEFDLVQLEGFEYGPMEAYRSVTHGGADFVDCERWLRHFAALEIERFAVCVLELRRDAYGRPPLTERRVQGMAVSPLVADWHFQFGRTMAARGDRAEERLAGERPRVAPGVRLAVHLESDAEGGWHTIGTAVETGWPSHGMVKAPALAPTLLELCDGTRELGGILEGLRSAGLVNEGVSAADVALLVEALAAAGALQLESCPLPPRPPGRQ